MRVNPNAVFIFLTLVLIVVATLITAPAYVWWPIGLLVVYVIYAVIP